MTMTPTTKGTVESHVDFIANDDAAVRARWSLKRLFVHESTHECSPGKVLEGTTR